MSICAAISPEESLWRPARHLPGLFGGKWRLLKTFMPLDMRLILTLFAGQSLSQIISMLIAVTQDEQPLKRSRGRPRSRQIDRGALLEHAMRLFWERGYETTSTRDLAATLGATQAELYAFFPDKQSLFKEALALYQKGAGSLVRKILAREPTARAAVHCMLLEVAREMTAHNRPAGCMLVTSAMNCATEQVRHHVAELRAAAQAQLQARIERGIQEGDVPANASATNLAAFYTAILQGLTIQARDGASAEALTSIAEHAMDAWPT